MRTRRQLANLVIEQAFQMLADNVHSLRIEEALFVPPGGYRSTLGTLKHIAGWSYVYRSYAFDAEPRHWEHIDLRRRRRETICSGWRIAHRAAVRHRHRPLRGGAGSVG